MRLITAFRTIVALLLTLFGSHCTLAQRHDNVWCFGQNIGWNFTAGQPTLFKDSFNIANTVGSYASISDEATGDLLFYTDGVSVYNRDFRVMPNGDGLLGPASSMILPDPGKPHVYYVFTLDQMGFNQGKHRLPALGLNYSVVDMTQDVGRGDVVLKNAHLLDSTGAELTAVRKIGSCDTWVLVHTLHDDSFHAFLVSPGGIAPPVVSHSGRPFVPLEHYSLDPEYVCASGCLTSSRDTKHLAMGTNFSYVQLFDFDCTSGIVSNARVIDSLWEFNGVAFSPDGTKLYYGHYDGTAANQYSSVLKQVDITRGASQGIQASLDTFWSGPYGLVPSCMSVGPDDKLYASGTAAEGFIGYVVLNNPDLKGLAAYPVWHLDRLPFSGRSTLGVPNMIPSYAHLPFPRVGAPSLGLISIQDTIYTCRTSRSWTIPIYSNCSAAGLQNVELQNSGFVLLHQPTGVIADVDSLVLGLTSSTPGSYVDTVSLTLSGNVQYRVPLKIVVLNARFFPNSRVMVDTLGEDILVPIFVSTPSPVRVSLSFDTSQFHLELLPTNPIISADPSRLGAGGISISVLQSVDSQLLGYAHVRNEQTPSRCVSLRIDSIGSIGRSPLFASDCSDSLQICFSRGCGSENIVALLPGDRPTVDISFHQGEVDISSHGETGTFRFQAFDVLGRPVSDAQDISLTAGQQEQIPMTLQGIVLVRLVAPNKTFTSLVFAQ